MRTLVGAVALTLLLAGCGGTSPKPSPVVESSASATTSPSGPPAMPAEAKGTTAESAKAFVDYYLSLLSYASTTGETDVLSGVAASDCSSCNGVVAKIRGIYDAGGHIEGKGYAAENATVEDKKVEGDPVVRIDLVSLKQLTFTANTTEPAVAEEARTRARFRVTHRDDQWLVAEWTRLS